MTKLAPQCCSKPGYSKPYCSKPCVSKPCVSKPCVSKQCCSKRRVSKQNFLTQVFLKQVFLKKSFAKIIQKVLKPLVIVMMIACMCSCTTKFAYNILDWGILWELGRYVSLSKQQKAASKIALNDFHTWHRSTQLPQYSNYLRAISSRIHQGKFTPQELAIEHEKVQILVNQSIEKLVNSALPILATLDDQQVINTISTLNKDREKYYKKYIKPSDKKRRKAREKEIRKIFKRFMGNLSEEQHKHIHHWGEGLIPYENQYYQLQKKWSVQIDKALKNRRNENLFKNKTLELILYPEKNWPAPFRETMSHNRQLTYQMLAKVINSATQKQKNKLQKRINNYVKDFEDLTRIKTSD